MPCMKDMPRRQQKAVFASMDRISHPQTGSTTHKEAEGLLFTQLKKANIPDYKFSSEQLKVGQKVEMEHTRNPEVAKGIAKAHLKENPNYYRVLQKVGL